MAQTALKTRSRQGLTFQVTVVVEPDGDGFHAYCPALKGLHVPGATIEEAVENARVAAQLFLECLVEDGDPIPVGVQLGPHRLHIPKKAVHAETLTLHLE